MKEDENLLWNATKKLFWGGVIATTLTLSTLYVYKSYKDNFDSRKESNIGGVYKQIKEDTSALATDSWEGYKRMYGDEMWKTLKDPIGSCKEEYKRVKKYIKED